VLHGLQDLPVLYLSRYIMRHKEDYYHHLQTVRESGDREAWILYILRAVEDTSRQTIAQVQAIRDLMQATEHRLRTDLARLYSQDLINNPFRHPYTKIDLIERDLGVSRQTATKYLTDLRDAGFLRKSKLGRTNFYINEPLFKLLST
jgi:Fic family protein